MIVNYNSQKNNGTKNWCSIIVRIRRKSYKAIHYEGEGDDNFYNEHVRSAIWQRILSAISARKSLYEIDNLIRSSMEEYGDLDEETESLL
jgi:hypothetical protein